MTAHYVSPDSDGNKLHLISIDASEQVKYLYAENGQKNESARWFTWSDVLSYEGGSWVSKTGTVRILAVDGDNNTSELVRFPDGAYGWARKENNILRIVFISPQDRWGYVREFRITEPYTWKSSVYLTGGHRNEQGEVCFEAWFFNNNTKVREKKAVVCY